MMAKTQDSVSRWIVLIAVLLLLGVMSLFFSLVIGVIMGGDTSYGEGNVAVIPVYGIIQSSEDDSFLSSTVASSETIVGLIEKAESDPSISAVIFDIDSPGGYPVPSHEIVEAIRDMNKTNVAVIRNIGASGAYWVASSTDWIFADSLSLTGSIGVNSAFLTFGGLLKEYNVTYERIVGGEFKDIGTPYREVTPEERVILSSLSSQAHDIFIKDVARNRDVPVTKIERLATGEVFLGADALQKGLIDEIGGMKEALGYLEVNLNITAVPVPFERERSFFDAISGGLSAHGLAIGQGIGESLQAGNSHQRLLLST